jgi:hypothetical protein
MISTEIWKPVLGYEGFYEISSLGRVRSVKRTIIRKNGCPQTIRERMLKTDHDGSPYLHTSLSIGGAVKTKSVHALVAEAFIPNPMKLPEVNHKDTNKRNNSIKNLEWMTRSEQQIHARGFGLGPENVGSRNGQSKFNEQSAAECRERFLMGESLRGLASSFGVHVEVVRSLVKRRTWRHVA